VYKLRRFLVVIRCRTTDASRVVKEATAIVCRSYEVANGVQLISVGTRAQKSLTYIEDLHRIHGGSCQHR
jgi:hypothetical protein